MTERTMVDVTLNVNGRSYEVRVEPRRTLADTHSLTTTVATINSRITDT